jgi:abortive infection bacteriophage resistance protein
MMLLKLNFIFGLSITIVLVHTGFLLRQTMRRTKLKPGTCFKHALNLYVLDRELRLLVLDAIERVEMSVRF